MGRVVQVTIIDEAIEIRDLGIARGPSGYLQVVPGHVEGRVRVTLKEGESKRVIVQAGAEENMRNPYGGKTPTPPRPPTSPPPSASGPPTEPSSGSGSRAIGGVGAASVAVSMITGALVLAKKGTVAQHCDASKTCDQQGLDAGAAGKTFSVVSTVTLLVGAAGLGLGAYFLVSSGDGKTVTAVGPSILLGGARAGFARSF